MSKQPTIAREIAFSVLERAQRGAWSDAALKAAVRRAELNSRDSALCSRICYGVQQNQLLLDFWISRYSKVPLPKLEDAVRIALRMGMYQTALMDRVPDRAAVSESVELVKRHSKNPNSSRLTNGILRSFCRAEGHWPEPEELGVRYSHPQWLVEQFRRELGSEDELEALLKANNSIPPTTVQVNTLRMDAASLCAELETLGVTAQPHPWLENCLELTGTGDLDQLGPFQDGKFWAQDAAARLAVLAAAPKPGERVLDACAAPGGKSFAAAMEMENRGELISCDVQKNKVKLLRSGAARLGISCMDAMLSNGKEFRPEWENRFDLVMADVPCSGLGIIRKKPDIRYKDPEVLDRLPEVQRAILNNVSRYVKPGGRLLYSTCTLLRRENQDVAEGFLSEHPAFSPLPLELPEPIGRVGEGMLTLWPHIHGTDGFFLAVMRKENA